MKSTIRFLIWLMTLNLLINFIFPEPVELWKFLNRDMFGIFVIYYG